MRRKDLSNKITEVEERVKMLYSITQNPLPLKDDFAEEITDMMNGIESRLKKLMVDLKAYVEDSTVNEETPHGRKMKLLDTIYSKEINALYYNNKIVEARALTDRISSVFEKLIDKEEDKECEEFYNEFKHLYDIKGTEDKENVEEKEKEDIKEIKVEEPVKEIKVEEPVKEIKPKPVTAPKKQLTAEELKRKTFFFGGPPLNKLIPLDANKEEHLEKLKHKLILVIKKVIKQGMTNFVIAGSLGFDDIVLDILEEFKKHNSDIRINIIIPYKSFTKHWSAKDKEKLNEHIKKADNVKYLVDSSDRSVSISDAINLRQRSLVEVSYCGLIAYYTGLTGASKELKLLAQKKDMQIFVFDPLTLQLSKE